ncbi:MAG: hypothetical protein HYU64_07370 [Armatimonadetes bacterium]|nr:hypothetical protein [Armatimonadota bacterium]
MLRNRLLILAALGFTLLALIRFSGCGQIARSTASEKIREKLPDLIGPADSYQVTLDSGVQDMLKGRAEKIQIIGKRVRPKSSPIVDFLQVDLSRIEVDLPRKSLKSLEKCTFQAQFLERDLNDYLVEYQREHPLKGDQGRSSGSHEISEARLSLGDRELSLRASFKTPILGMIPVQAPIGLAGSIEVKDKVLLYFVPRSMDVAGVSLPKPLAEALLAKINPVADLSKLSVPTRVSKIEIRPGLLWVEGEADLPIPEARQTR